MNREIKFRIWNKKTNKWVYGPGKEVNLFGEIILFGGFLTKIPLIQILNDCIALQFTGMRDKVGNEVYEGDIVCENMTEELAAEGGESNLGKVYFAAGCFMIDGDGSLFDHTFSTSPDILEDYTVVGNAFDNPELLIQHE